MDSERQEQPNNQQAQAPGAQLAAQRQAMGLSIDQIADQLKLAPRQVVAIEQGDYASLPNMAVTRGFIRAYAKVVRLDPAPLVAQIEVTPAVAPTADHGTVRREKISTSFSESRFPSLTESRSKPTRWLIGGAVVLVLAAAAAAWQSGVISTDLFKRSGGTTETVVTPSQPGTATTALPAPTVPLVQPTTPAPAASEPPAAAPPAAPAAETAPATTATQPPVTTAPAAPVVATPAAGATTPAAPAAGPNALVLTVNQDSWIEVRSPGSKPLISRLVKAGSTETVEIDKQSTLVVGNPDGVRATLRGQPVDLPKLPNRTISRVTVK
jgi:cytoskeleton protein RodZ